MLPALLALAQGGGVSGAMAAMAGRGGLFGGMKGMMRNWRKDDETLAEVQAMNDEIRSQAANRNPGPPATSKPLVRPVASPGPEPASVADEMEPPAAELPPRTAGVSDYMTHIQEQRERSPAESAILGFASNFRPMRPFAGAYSAYRDTERSNDAARRQHEWLKTYGSSPVTPGNEQAVRASAVSAGMMAPQPSWLDARQPVQRAPDRKSEREEAALVNLTKAHLSSLEPGHDDASGVETERRMRGWAKALGGALKGHAPAGANLLEAVRRDVEALDSGNLSPEEEEEIRARVAAHGRALQFMLSPESGAGYKN